MLKRFLFGGTGGGSPLADLGLFVLRAFAGFVLALTHGLAKVQKPSVVIGMTDRMGFPAPTLFGWLAIFTEFGGGLLLAIGLATRPAALLVACTMAAAGFVFHADDPLQVKELAFLYLAVAILFLFTGSGRFGVDAMIAGGGGGGSKPFGKSKER